MGAPRRRDFYISRSRADLRAGRRGKGKREGGESGEEREKKKGGEKKRVFFTLEAFPPPVQSNCHTAMHFRERVGGKEGKKGGKGRKKGEKRERRVEKEEGKEGGKGKDLTKDP